MNSLHTIKSIQGIPAFSSLHWRGAEAKRYNLIYGWNRSGKTTLSRILGCFEHGSVNFEGLDTIRLRLKTSSGTVTQDDVSSDKLICKVFNDEYIDKQLSFRESSAHPIVILGKASVDLENDIEKLRTELGTTERNLEKESAKLEELPDLESILKNTANRVVAEFAQTPLANKKYNGRRYNKGNIKSLLDNEVITKDNVASYFIDKPEKVISLRDRVASRASTAKLPKLDVGELLNTFNEANRILQLNVAVTTIERMEKSPGIREWVRTGYHLHNDQDASTCLFCEQQLPESLLTEYGKYFTDEITKEENALKDIVRRLEEITETLAESLPDSSHLFADLRETYSKEKEVFGEASGQLLSSCEVLREKLLKRRGRLQLTETRSSEVSFPLQAFEKRSHSYKELQKIVEIHNDRISSDDQQRAKIAKVLEFHTVSERLVAKNYFDEKSRREILEGKIDAYSLRKQVKGINESIAEKRGSLRDS